MVGELIPREMLYIADEVFFSGTAAEITPIRSVDRIQIGAGKRGPITEKLQKEFFAIVEGRTPDRFGWLRRSRSRWERRNKTWAGVEPTGELRRWARLRKTTWGALCGGKRAPRNVAVTLDRRNRVSRGNRTRGHLPRD